MSDIYKEAITPKTEPKRKPIDSGMLEFAKNVILANWLPSINFDPSVFRTNDLDTMAAWIAAYCFNHNNPELCDRPRKCLLLCGKTGRGKTTLAKLFQSKFILPMYTADDLDKIANDEESASYYVLRAIYGAESDLIIDDIGAEALRTRFGNAPEFPQMLQRIYDAWKFHGKLIIATTNGALSEAGLGDFTKRYGERTAERLAEMFMPVYLTGETNYRRDGK